MFVKTSFYVNQTRCYGQINVISSQVPGHEKGWKCYTNAYNSRIADIKLCNNLSVPHTKLNTFYTPVWKTGRIMPWQCPSVRLSVRLSVRPSVRPCFPDFSSTCFEISIWNLVYTFSRWHDMSSLSCITIGSLWPSLQPKVGQTYFLQSRPHKSR